MKRILALGAVLMLATTGSAVAQQNDGPKRVALVIGEADYANAPEAETAIVDTRVLARALGDAGWRVTSGTDLDRGEMRDLFAHFAERATDADQIVIYYNGHALHAGGDTYLAPTDMQTDSLVDALFDGVPLSLALQLAGRAPDGAAVFLDAAQLKGFAPTELVEPGLADIEAPDGVVVVSAAPPGQAVRRKAGDESRFVQTIVDRFLKQDAAVMATASDIGGPVWVTGKTDGNFVLNPEREKTGNADIERQVELAYWRAAERSGRAEDYRTYLNRYPNGEFAKFAHDRLDELNAQTSPQTNAQQPASPAEQTERGLNLTRSQIRNAQQWLRATDHEPGAVDGLMGPNTRSALRDWQKAQGFDATGYLTQAQFDRLSTQGEAALAEQRRAQEQQKRVAEAQDNGYWAATGAEGTAQGYRAYLDKYPQGLHADEARAALDQMAEAKADTALRKERRQWHQAKRSDTVAAYRDYLDQYPQGVWAEDARGRIDQITSAEQQQAQQSQAARTEAAIGLNQRDKLSLEQRLRSLGYNPGPLDGEFSQQTRTAIENYQASRGLEPTGYIDRETLNGIVRETSQAQITIDGADIVRGLLGAFGQVIQNQQQ